jgi:hypothetical protein
MRTALSSPKWLLLLLLLQTLCCVVNGSQGSKCTDSVPRSWTSDQKKQFCQAASAADWASPVECAAQARADLKLKFDDVYLLCVDAASTAPVACMVSLSKKEREQYGVSLCTRAVSEATSKCWHEMTAYKGKSKVADTMQILTFCRELDGPGPQHCVRTALDALGVAPALSMAPCANALMRSSPGTMASCLALLKPHVYAATSGMAAREHGRKGVLDSDAIDFCSAAPSEEAAQCFLASANMKLSAGDRLKLCYGADSAAGPVDCFNHLLFDNKRLSTASSPHDSGDTNTPRTVVQERVALGVALCAMAADRGPAVCFNEGLRSHSADISAADSVLASRSGGAKTRGRAPDPSQSFGDTDLTLLQLCQGSVGTGPVECFRKSQAVFRPADLSSDSSIAWHRSMHGPDTSPGMPCPVSVCRYPCLCPCPCPCPCPCLSHCYDVLCCAVLTILTKLTNTTYPYPYHCPDPDGAGGLGIEMRVHLCLHASSPAPAECGLKAPQVHEGALSSFSCVLWCGVVWCGVKGYSLRFPMLCYTMLYHPPPITPVTPLF